MDTIARVASAGKARAVDTVEGAKHMATCAKDKTVETVCDRTVQATAASAAAGAALLGTGGAAAGLLLGGVTGGALGLLPAIFTFGLSIPAGAALGGGLGAVAGGMAGGATGATLFGGTVYAYRSRHDIRSLFGKARHHGMRYAQEVQQKGGEYAQYAKQTVQGAAGHTQGQARTAAA